MRVARKYLDVVELQHLDFSADMTKEIDIN